MVPENVTLLPKTKDQITGGNPTGERVHIVKKGDTVTSILREQGATPEDAKSIATTLGARGRDGGLKEGQKLRILMAPAGPGQRLQPYRVIVANDSAVEAVVALSDLGKYVAVDVQSMNTVDRYGRHSDDDDDDGTGVRLYQSIYETALRNKVPAAVIEDMVRIYSYDVDFQRKVQPGDSFDVFFAGEDEGSTITEKTEVLFASLTVGGETKKYYRFQTPDDAVVDFYDETGKSAKKFLVRKPVNNAIMRSGFGSRRHPILGYGRAGPTRSPATSIAMSGGWTPSVHLFSQSRGKLAFDEATRTFLPGAAVQAQVSVGACRGVFDLAAALADGAKAGAEAAGATPGQAPRVEGAHPRVGRHVGRRRADDRRGAVESVRRFPERRHRARHPARDARGHALDRAHQALHHDRDGDRPGQDVEHERARHRGGIARTSRSRRSG